MKFKLPKNIISNNVFKNVLYLVSLALAVSYIINEQNLALMSLILIACGVYIMNKSVVIALFISIIATNLLLSMNYLKEFDVIEGMAAIKQVETEATAKAAKAAKEKKQAQEQEEKQRQEQAQQLQQTQAKAKAQSQIQAREIIKEIGRGTSSVTGAGSGTGAGAGSGTGSGSGTSSVTGTGSRTSSATYIVPTVRQTVAEAIR